MPRSLIGLAILLLICITQIECWAGGLRPPVKPYSPKKYKIDLDLPPKQRWTELISDFKTLLNTFRDYVVNLLGVSPFYLNFIPFTFAMSYDSEFAAEISAIADLAGLSFNEVYLMNFLYEFSAMKACTSIVLRTERGRIIHGRNIDFDFQTYLANLSSVGVFYQNGNPLYEANVIAGYTGILSGLKFGKFGITMNERNTSSYWNNLGEYFLHRSIPSAYLLRKVLEKADTFDEAVYLLSKKRLIAPTYFIVGGIKPYEGVVITRDSDEVRNMSWISGNDPSWSVVHTNYDQDMQDPFYNYRRVPAEKNLNATQQKNVSEQVLMDAVLSQYPNLNIETILTAIFSTETGYYNKTI